MSFFEIIFIAIGLGMDAFSVSLGSATSGLIRGARATFRLSFHFGLFQFLMPIIGWYLGTKIEPLISSIDHWVAFVLLTYVGGRMIYQSFDSHEPTMQDDPSKGMSLVMLSVATSIDALAVGLSLAMIQVDIWYPSVMIGIITAAMSLIGIRIGKKFRGKFGNKIEILGGLILIAIGIRILLSDLFFG